MIGQGSLNDLFLGHQRIQMHDCMVILMDFPYNSAVFGVVM